jgi:hypothetical protein
MAISGLPLVSSISGASLTSRKLAELSLNFTSFLRNNPEELAKDRSPRWDSVSISDRVDVVSVFPLS